MKHLVDADHVAESDMLNQSEFHLLESVMGLKYRKIESYKAVFNFMKVNRTETKIEVTCFHSVIW